MCEDIKGEIIQPSVWGQCTKTSEVRSPDLQSVVACIKTSKVRSSDLQSGVACIKTSKVRSSDLQSGVTCMKTSKVRDQLIFNLGPVCEDVCMYACC